MTGAVLVLNVFFVFLSDASFALLVGGLLAGHWLKKQSESLRPLHRVCLAGLLIGHIVRPWFTAASMTGSSGFSANLAVVPDILTSTHLGKVWFLGAAALIVLLITRRTIPVAISLILIACAKAASGHAAGEGDFTLAELSMFLHIAGTAVWAGTVVVSGLIVIPTMRKHPAVWNYAKLLSTTITVALAVILLSGAYTSWNELSGTLSGLWTSGWGKILMTKLACVAVALALGATTRFKCVQPNDRAALMVRLMRVEASVMILILSLSALLANTAPAMAGM